MAAFQATGSGYCDGVTCGHSATSSTPTSSSSATAHFGFSKLLEKESTADEEYIDPAQLGPGAWTCNCLPSMEAACPVIADRADCFKDLMCQDNRIAQAWKNSHCPAGSTAGCTALMEVGSQREEAVSALNDTLQDQSDKAADSDAFESRNADAFDSASLDDSLSGKRACR